VERDPQRRAARPRRRQVDLHAARAEVGQLPNPERPLLRGEPDLHHQESPGVAAALGGARAAGLGAENALAGRKQLVEAEWLQDVRCHPFAHPAHERRIAPGRGEDEYGGRVGSLPDALEDLPAVDDRHHQVEHHQVGPGGGDQREGLSPVAGHLHVVN
jgi:hypothetical protein